MRNFVILVVVVVGMTFGDRRKTGYFPFMHELVSHPSDIGYRNEETHQKNASRYIHICLVKMQWWPLASAILCIIPKLCISNLFSTNFQFYLLLEFNIYALCSMLNAHSYNIQTKCQNKIKPKKETTKYTYTNEKKIKIN